MGKHERQLIEEAEKIIVKILNRKTLNTMDRKNRWLAHAWTIARKVKQDFPTITSVEHLGNRYDNTGDILIVSKGKKFFVETKMSDTKLGIGTKANISQDAFTENGLFTGKVKSWSKFRYEKGHDRWVNTFLNQFTKYPESILKITNPTEQKEEKARFLREQAEKGNKKAESILNNIQRQDRKEKIEYLTYLSKQRQQKEIIKRFFILITLGIHTKEALSTLIKQESFFGEVQNLLIYYANLYKSRVIVSREDSGQRIRKILKECSNFRIIFPKQTTHCKILCIKDKTFKPLLQIVFHWKNIAQGIKTPCLNIFDLRAKSTLMSSYRE